MSFLRHPQIYPPIWPLICTGGGPLSGFAPGPHRLDESAAGYSLAGCAPAEPASASPDEYEYAVQWSCRSRSFHTTANSVLTVHLGLRPAKPYENVSEFRTMEPRSGEIEQTVEKSRLFNCLIRSVRIERISGRCLS